MLKKLLPFVLALTLLVCSLTGCQPKEEGTDFIYRRNGKEESYTLTRVEYCPNDVKIDTFNGMPVTAIASRVFYGVKYEHIRSVVIGDNVKTIGESAFWYSPHLSQLVLGKGLEYIGESAFEDCDSLSYVNIPDRVYEIGARAFAICDDRLSRVDMGKCVSIIGEEAFEACLALREINLPLSLTRIGHAAFAECKSLTHAFYEGTAEDWARVEVEGGNAQLVDHLYFFSAEKPAASGNYWHYGAGGHPEAW